MGVRADSTLGRLLAGRAYSVDPDGRSAATAGVTTAAIPKGYIQTASTGLPHIFGD